MTSFLFLCLMLERLSCGRVGYTWSGRRHPAGEVDRVACDVMGDAAPSGALHSPPQPADHWTSEFRANATEADPAKIAQHQETAVRGLSQLQAYTGLQEEDANWEVKMEGESHGKMGTGAWFGLSDPAVVVGAGAGVWIDGG